MKLQELATSASQAGLTILLIYCSWPLYFAPKRLSMQQTRATANVFCIFAASSCRCLTGNRLSSKGEPYQRVATRIPNCST
ncbi:hypothetical protein AOX55_00002557 [Sinorhizobium fredii CCBAU 25509]|nr:hypothetical protein AOX55_00002557 [Sinorhizobium fredii CCBAU 25509]